MPKSGDVLFYKDFEFEDRSKSNKLFIVLCSDSYCLVLKTTSDKLGFYQGVKQGCNPQRKVFLIRKEEKEGFPLDTYVQFPHLIEISVPEHWEQIFSGVPNTPSTDSLKELALKFKSR